MLNYKIEADGLHLTDDHGNHAGWIVREAFGRWTVAMDIPGYEPVAYGDLDAAKYRALADFMEAARNG